MSNLVPPNSGIKIGGLGRKAQKLQALREKAAQQATGTKPTSKATDLSMKSKGAFAPTKKTSFQRKAV